MATGAPGTNGVWQYGEDDSEATFSALLNKVASTTDTQIGTDRGRLTTLEARKLSALTPVVPSSVSVASGSGSFNSTTGVITFTGATSISINGCFTSTYKNYKIMMFDSITNTVNSAIKFRLRNSGTDSTGLYYQRGFTNAGTTLAAYTASNITWWDLAAPPFAAVWGSFSMDIFAPQIAQRTSANFTSVGYSTDVNAVGGGLLHDAASIYDGFSIITNSAATFTGKLQIMGYN